MFQGSIKDSQIFKEKQLSLLKKYRCRIIKEKMKGFINFIREQGVVGLAVGFILGGAVSKLVSAIVTDLINPILGIILGMAGNLREASLAVGPIKIMWGDLTASLIDFLTIAAVVYFGFKVLRLERLDKKKS
jgi:large conductance mechanosensitive channel